MFCLAMLHCCCCCCRGRQKDFVDTELRLGRTDPAEISALVGYAGNPSQTELMGRTHHLGDAFPRPPGVQCYPDSCPVLACQFSMHCFLTITGPGKGGVISFHSVLGGARNVRGTHMKHAFTC